MTDKELTRAIMEAKKTLSDLYAEQEKRRIFKLEQECNAGLRVLKYPMLTGDRYRCGETTYFVKGPNRYGEYRITQGKSVIVKSTRRPVAELSELFGVTSYNSVAIRVA